MPSVHIDPRFFKPRTAISWGALAILFLSVSRFSDVSAQERHLVIRGREVVVSYKPTRSTRAVGTLAVRKLRLPSDLRVRSVSEDGAVAVVTTRETTIASEGAVQVDDEDIKRACQRILYANRGVPLSCGVNRIVQMVRTPDDPELATLYGLTQMSAANAWEISTGSTSVVVAVVDTGVNYNHPDLQANITVNSGELPANSIDDDNNGFVDDYFGYDFSDGDGDPADEHSHGSHVAGIIGASGNNGYGVVGINWNVGILPVRVLSASGSGTEADVASGIRYAVTRGASVINLSLAGSGATGPIEEALAYARSAGVLVVAAAGNASTSNEEFPTYPASSTLDNVVAVAATDSADNLAWFSNYGVTSVDVGAPGVAILSTVLGSNFALSSGTSMATPYVAGLAALIKSVNGALGYSDIRTVILGTTDPVPVLNGKTVTGGRVNAEQALLVAQGATPAPTPPVEDTPVVEPGTSADGNQLSIRSRRLTHKILIYGYIKDAQGGSIADTKVNLLCANVARQRIRSDDDGYYAFKISRPRQKTKCYVQDSESNRSRKHRVI